MASTWSELGIRLMATGENSNAWGGQTNDNWNRIEDAADGFATVAVSGATTLTFTTEPTSYADENGRNKVLVFTGTAGSTQAITFPNIEKTYHVLNDSNSVLTLTTGTGAATVSLAAGKDMMIYNDGSDEIHNALANLSITSLLSPTIDASGVITGGTVEATTTTAAGDNAAMGYTSALGLMLTGQGSTNDVTIRNDANADVITIATGTTVVGIPGSIDLAGDIDVDGTANLDIVDIDGALTQDGGAVFNEASADVDFRVESNGNANMLFVDGGNDLVNIGTSTAYAGKLNIETTDNSFNLFLVSTDADANAGPNMKFYRNSGSPADNDVMGNIHFTGRNDNSQDVDYAHIETLATDVSDGAEDGYMNIYVAHAGTKARSRIEMDSTEMVINEGGADLDFRVESDGNTHMLFVDAGDDRLFIGSNAGTNIGQGQRIQVMGNSQASSGMSLMCGSADAIGPSFEFLKSRNTAIGSRTIVADDDIVGRVVGRADDGTDMNSALAEIRFSIDGTPGENDTPGRISFYTTPDGSASLSERLRIHNNGVASFNNGVAIGVGTANTASNVLDDYEEGSFTASITDGSGNAFTMVSGFETLTYRKVGDVVRIGGYLRTSAINSATGTSPIEIRGLPFTVLNSQAAYGGLAVGYYNNFDLSAATDIPLILSNKNDTKLIVYAAGASNSRAVSLTPAEWSADGEMIFSGWYLSNA